jgi:hypothetical protein
MMTKFRLNIELKDIHLNVVVRVRAGASAAGMPLLDETTEALSVRYLSIERREELMIK